jgi:hypothetical protein
MVSVPDDTGIYFVAWTVPDESVVDEVDYLELVGAVVGTLVGRVLL